MDEISNLHLTRSLDENVNRTHPQTAGNIENFRQKIFQFLLLIQFAEPIESLPIYVLNLRFLAIRIQCWRGIHCKWRWVNRLWRNFQNDKKWRNWPFWTSARLAWLSGRRVTRKPPFHPTPDSSYTIAPSAIFCFRKPFFGWKFSQSGLTFWFRFPALKQVASTHLNVAAALSNAGERWNGLRNTTRVLQDMNHWCQITLVTCTRNALYLHRWATAR